MTKSVCTFKVCHTAFSIYSMKLQHRDSQGEPRGGFVGVHLPSTASHVPNLLERELSNPPGDRQTRIKVLLFFLGLSS